jgi:nicotinamidase-related amidase
MIRQLLKKRRKWILIDINTQKDYFFAWGNACIKNHRRVLANVRRMMAWAKRNDVRVISTCEVYPNHNGVNETGYCIDGTEGQKKIRYTLLSNRVSFPADGSTDFPADILRQYRQVVLHKRCVDPFNEPRIERLLSEVRADNFVLIGASAEGAVKAMALGLLQRGKKVSVVIDAVGLINKREAKLAFRKMRAKGAKLIETKKLAGVSHLRQVGICDCESCRRRVRKTAVKTAARY